MQAACQSPESLPELGRLLTIPAEEYTHSPTRSIHLGEFSVREILGSGMVFLQSRLEFIPTHSFLSASTGSFFAASPAGISPAIIVSTIEITTSAIPPATGS